MEKTLLRHMASASCQENQPWLWMQQLRTAAQSMARVSLTLIVMLLVVGFSLAFVGQGNIVHAVQANGQPQVPRSAEAASNSMATVPTTIVLNTGNYHILAKNSSGIKLPLSTYGTGGGTTFIFKNVTINVKTQKLEVEFEFS